MFNFKKIFSRKLFENNSDKCESDKSKIYIRSQRRYYVQSKNCSVNSMVAHVIPKGKFALENGLVHITPNVI